MLAAVLTDHDFALLAPARGQFPVQTLVLGPTGWARVDLLPAIAVVAAEGLDAEAGRLVMGLVARHRDALLTAWAAPAPALAPGVPDGPRATGVAWDPARKTLAVRLNGGAVLTFAAAMVPGLAEADPALAADVAAVAGGEALVWRRLGLYARVADLVLGATGGPAWRERLSTAGTPPWNAQPRSVGAPAPGTRPPASAPGTVKSLLGLILQRENYVSAEQVQAIFRRQMELRQAGREATFGEIALESGLLTPERLSFATHLQERLAHAADGGKPLGVYLLESAAVMPSQLLAAMEEQKATGARLGEVLIGRGLIGRHLLDEFLARQREVRGEAAPAPEPATATATVPEAQPAPVAAGAEAAPAPAAEAPAPAPAEPPKIKSLLGIILEREGYVTQAQVRQITDEQERSKAGGRNVTFGEVAMTMGILQAEQLKFAVGLQKRLAYDTGRAKPIGLLLLENGVLKPSQVHHALDLQAKSGRRLGEILIEQGLISEGMLEVFLNMQKQGT